MVNKQTKTGRADPELSKRLPDLGEEANSAGSRLHDEADAQQKAVALDRTKRWRPISGVNARA